MKLDDRPVIDQLTEPTPLNILHDIEAHMTTLIDGGQFGLSNAIFLTLCETHADLFKRLNAEDQDALLDIHNGLAGDLADAECERRHALIDLAVKELEARL